jgi:hypothetical protein
MRDLVGKGKPFHSALDKAAGLLKRKVGTGAEFMQELKALGGIKQAEIDERKLGEIMGMPRMTHDQFMANLSTRPAPAINEKVLGGDQDDPNWIGPYHYQYTLPGGENYREILIKAPQPEYGQDKIMELEAKLRRAPPDKVEHYQALIDKMQRVAGQNEQFPGVGAHFGGEAGILASMRVKDRMVPDEEGPHNVKVIGGGGYTNVKHPTREAAEKFAQVKHQGGYKTEITPLNHKKYLHLEELQSDWHQQGRERGYGKVQRHEYEVVAPNGQLLITLRDKNEAEDYAKSRGATVVESEPFTVDTGVPDAPFKKNWEEMALKRLIHHAAEKGYHGVVVTPGAEQADRYSLAKHIDSLSYEKKNDKYHLRYVPKGGGTFEPLAMSVAPEELPSHVGKEMAEKIVNGEGNRAGSTGIRTFPNIDLQVGGEGMKGFYDKKVPNILNAIGKKYGVKTQLHGHKLGDIPDLPEDHEPEDVESRAKMAETPLHHFPITEDMRKDILTNGLPLYAEGGTIHKAEGGKVQPSIAQMKMALSKKTDPISLKNIGINEAPGMAPKMFFAPDKEEHGIPAPGGVATPSGMPIGGVDTNAMQGGQQLMPNIIQPPLAPQGVQPPQGGQSPQGAAPQGPTPPMGNLLQMTPQGQALSAMGPSAPQGKPMAKGGSLSVDDMKAELAKAKKPKKAKAAPAAEGDDGDEEEEKAPSKRILVKGEGPGGATGIVIPHHMLHGRSWISKKTGKKVVVPGMLAINEARAKVYGSENRDPLNIGQIAKNHEKTLNEHFAKPLKEQLAAEKEATQRLRDAKHLGAKNNTLDESEKLDTVRHETDEQGRTHVGFASKGVAGRALYLSGHGKNLKHHILNTCPGQTEGCGGGLDKNGVADTSKGTCFAPNAESQYVNAAVRRAAHEQAKHDPAMTNDWILAHTGSMRDAAKKADKNNQRLLFRPNVVDETDVSSRHVLRHLNAQRKEEGKPDIIANSYGKTNELHDPENGYHVTHSNVGPKVKKGEEIGENIGRDKARIRNTIMAADNKGDFKNAQGNKTPPKGSYMVTDVKRGSPLAKKMEEHITHAKYWSEGRPASKLSEEEKAEGPEGHFGPNGKQTSEDKAHYGHRTVGDMRFDYQRQHILHPRLVNVPIRKKNKKTGEMETKDHMIPTDSRFMDTKFLPKNRFKTKNGKDAGHILMTTPTESTSNLGHETSFTHHVNQKHIEHAMANKGEYEIDKPEDQIKAAGKEYRQPVPVKLPSTMKLAEGGSVSFGRHIGYSDDDFHAFPESNVAAQRHLAMRRGEDEGQPKYHSRTKNSVAVHKNMDTMRLELTKKAK